MASSSASFPLDGVKRESSTAAASSSSSCNPFRDLLDRSGSTPPLNAASTDDDATPYVWMKLEKDGTWKPLRHADNARLEQAMREGYQSGPITVENGRYQVDLPKREMSAVYWDKDIRPVLRTSWFSKATLTSCYLPHDEKDALLIENLYREVVDDAKEIVATGGGELLPRAIGNAAASSGKGGGGGSSSNKVLLTKEVALSDGVKKVVATIKEVPITPPPPFSASQPPVSTTTTASKSDAAACGHRRCSPGKAQGGSGDQNTKPSVFNPVPGIEIEFVQQRINYGIAVIHNKILRRGLGEYEAEGEKDEDGRQPDQLVFVVHGIGEKIWSNDTIQGMMSLRSSVEILRKSTLEQQIKHLEKSSPTRIKPGGGIGASTSSSTCPANATSSTNSSSAAGKGEGGGGGLDHSTTGAHEDYKKCRTEFVPIEWFDATDDEGGEMTKRLQRVTLPSVPLFRQFANDAVMDVLLYMNPTYRQRILKVVGGRLNTLYRMFMEKNPSFKGKISLVGHSLGSVILFDLLAHQKGHQDDDIVNPLDAVVDYPQLNFPVHLFLTLGSPIGLFLTVRDQTLKADYRFPTVERFYNVFHPLDPVAYRIEPILQPAMAKMEPALVPHHEGTGQTFVTKVRQNQRAVVGSLNAFSTSAKSFLGSISSLAVKPSLALTSGGVGGGGGGGFFSSSSSSTAATTPTLSLATEGGETLRTLTIQEGGSSHLSGRGEEVQAATAGGEGVKKLNNNSTNSNDGSNKSQEELEAEADPRPELLAINGGQRVDYAMQEAFSEQLNEYISAISSHASYFGSPDVAYFIVRLLHGLDV